MIDASVILRVDSLHLQPDDFLFCYDDGSRVGETWWHEHFKAAFKRIEIDPGRRQAQGSVRGPP